jgi:ComEC/Rec2-related protein
MTTKETKDTDRYIDRPFNIRPLCFWAFFVGLTVTVCMGARNAPGWIFAYFVCLICVFVGLQFLKCRDRVLEFFGTSRVNFVVTIGLCLVVAFSFAMTTIAYTNQKSFAGFNDLRGVVERYNLNDDGSGWFILTDAKFGKSTVSGKVAVYTNPNETTPAISSTVRIKVNTQLRRAAASDYNINNNIKYTANINASDVVEVRGNDKSPRSVVLRHSQSFLRKHMSTRNADLMYSMLFGDRSTLDGDLSEGFRLTGLAHILSVSGLHVGILVGLLGLLLKLCRVPRKHQLWVIVAVLCCYIYLCNFRYPIIRASIMFTVFRFRRIFLKSNDLLSSISVAAIIVLMLFPYSLVSVSFISSFTCVIGIAFFNQPYTKMWNRALRIRGGTSPPVRSWLVKGLAMYSTIIVVWLPLTIRYFGFVPLLGIFTNVLLLPLVILAFQASIISVFTWLTFPVLYLVNIMLNAVIATTSWMASLPFSHINLSVGGYWFLIYYLGLIFTTRYIFTRRRYKYPVAAICILIFALFVIF